MAPLGRREHVLLAGSGNSFGAGGSSSLGSVAFAEDDYEQELRFSREIIIAWGHQGCVSILPFRQYMQYTLLRLLHILYCLLYCLLWLRLQDCLLQGTGTASPANAAR